MSVSPALSIVVSLIGSTDGIVLSLLITHLPVVNCSVGDSETARTDSMGLENLAPGHADS